MSWISSHWAELTAVLLTVLRVAESIANLTPTDRDNKIIATIKEFFRFG